MEKYGQSVIPSFLYSCDFQPSLINNNRNPISYLSPCSSVPSPNHNGESRSFIVQAPREPAKKIEMFSPAYYAACTAGGILSCGLTHTGVTPLDLVKCNMQVLLFQIYSNPSLPSYFYQAPSCGLF